MRGREREKAGKRGKKWEVEGQRGGEREREREREGEREREILPISPLHSLLFPLGSQRFGGRRMMRGRRHIFIT